MEKNKIINDVIALWQENEKLKLENKKLKLRLEHSNQTLRYKSKSKRAVRMLKAIKTL